MYVTDCRLEMIKTVGMKVTMIVGTIVEEYVGNRDPSILLDLSDGEKLVEASVGLC